MKRSIATVLTVAALSVGVGATAANAMSDQELNMLTGSVYFELRQLGLPTDNIDKLSLAEIAQIHQFINGEEGMGRVQKIKKILAEHE